MLRNIVCAGIVLSLSLGIALAETVKGKIESVDGNKITVMVKKDKKTYTAAPNVKVQRMAGKDKQPVAEGLKSADIKAGAPVTLEVTGDTITEITLPKAKK
jgi:hypothetical protein